jgi:hypothetical protein
MLNSVVVIIQLIFLNDQVLVLVFHKLEVDSDVLEKVKVAMDLIKLKKMKDLQVPKKIMENHHLLHEIMLKHHRNKLTDYLPHLHPKKILKIEDSLLNNILSYLQHY